MSSSFGKVDDKFVPFYRIMWISELPHFCGAEGCEIEGRYEVRIEPGDSLFGTREERDALLAALDHWQLGGESGEEPEDWA